MTAAAAAVPGKAARAPGASKAAAIRDSNAAAPIYRVGQERVPPIVVLAAVPGKDAPVLPERKGLVTTD